MPASPAYGRLAVLAQWCCGAELRCGFRRRFCAAARYGRRCGADPDAAQPEAALFATMERLTAAAFGNAARCCAERCAGWREALLERAASSRKRRAETLAVAEFDRLARLL